jgi:hypothetical protein
MSERLIRTGAIADESASIRTVNIPKSVIFIWDGALALKNLIRITVDAKNTVYTSQDGVLFTKSLYTLIQYPMGSPEKAYTIPDSTFEVAHMSFGNAEKGALRALTVGKSVATVGTMNAGYGYRDSADSAPLNFAVGEWFYISTFMNLSGVVTIDEENTSFTVYKGAVYDSEMTELYLVFDKSITEYEAPDSLLIIDVGAFYYCRYLKTVSLPSNLIEIRVYAFGFCNISSLFYDGGGDEWNEIRKEDGWNYRASIQAYRFSD